MFFKNKLRSICDCLDVQFRGMRRPGQNSADIGELAELFVKEFLRDCLSDMFRVFRGGKVVTSNGNESAQIDVIVTTTNTPKIFTDKGIYPIETVVSCIAVTSTLELPKLKSDGTGLSTVPTVGASFHSDVRDDPIKSARDMIDYFQSIPFKCVIGFEGNISQEWADEIDREGLARGFPDLVFVNKKGMILKLNDQQIARLKFTGTKRSSPGGQFLFLDFSQTGEYQEPLALMLNEFYALHTIATKYLPAMGNYFKQDVGPVIQDFIW